MKTVIYKRIPYELTNPQLKMTKKLKNKKSEYNKSLSRIKTNEIRLLGDQSRFFHKNMQKIQKCSKKVKENSGLYA